MKMAKQRRRNDGINIFWRDVSIAGGQVTFGVFAVLWFVPPFDIPKIGVLLLNCLATTWFILRGLKIAKDL
ncbi:hypothetical protein HZB78_04405 [Candidatus Collierbacteria bacterium]|nr:hypothetical protein [Candidatus Collierbacteria bacterium]